MKTILVPVDFSPASRTAAGYAAMLALQFDAKVHLLHVYLEPAPGAELPALWTIQDSEFALESHRKLQSEISYCREKYNLDFTGAVVPGFTADTIIDTARDIKADLVVMGMKKDKGRLFGSTVTNTIRKGTTPVCIVPEGFIYEKLRDLACAVDLDTTFSHEWMRSLVEIVDKFSATLHIIHVCDTAYTADQDTRGKLHVKEAFSGVKHTYRSIIGKEVNEALFEFVALHDCDLLVMFAHHHNLLERMMRRPHTVSMAYKTEIPLLVFRE